MANQTGIAITIKAFLVTGKSLDEQLKSLTMVHDAHASGDYTELLKISTIDEVKTEQKTRRVDEPAPMATVTATEAGGGNSPTMTETEAEQDASGLAEAFSEVEPANEDNGTEVPEFIKNGKKK